MRARRVFFVLKYGVKKRILRRKKCIVGAVAF